MDVDRRTFLRYAGHAGAGLMVAGAGGGLLAACGSKSTVSSPTTSGTGAPRKALGTFAEQLNWVSDFEFAGSYMADSKGYWMAEGFDHVSLIPGGTAVQVEPKIVSGEALMGYGVTANVVTANSKGAGLKVIGAGMQKNPLTIMSLPGKPITKPADIAGTKIGVPVNSEAIWAAFLSYHKISPSSYTKVPVQFDPSPLTSGQVDGILAFATNQPITLRLKGLNPVLMYLADFGFDYFEQLYVVSAKSLTDKRPAVIAALRGERKGWTDVIADPAAGAALTVSRYGTNLGLDPKQQQTGLEALVGLMQGPATKDKGLFYMTDAAVASSVQSLQRLGFSVDASLFTNEILNEM
ncbi:MAG: ABC transporter substrate-binding protein [Actinomycetota bacterium]|nr:ABC transporter substrate-binding protein [Actinomycetota bacterium]